MRAFLLHAKYSLLIGLRSKELYFWGILFPIGLATVLHAGLGNLVNFKLDAIPVGVQPLSKQQQLVHKMPSGLPSAGQSVEGKIPANMNMPSGPPPGITVSNEMILANVPYATVLPQIPLFKTEVMTPEEGRQALFDKKIDAYIANTGAIEVRDSDISASIVQSVITTVQRYAVIFQNGMPSGNSMELVDMKEDTASLYLVPYLSILGMLSLYSMFGISGSVTAMQANLSEIGKRFFVSPVQKPQYILSMVVTSVATNLTANVVVMIYMIAVLKMDVFTNIPITILFMLLGNVVGVLFGMAIASLLRISENAKIAIFVITALGLSALSGQMFVELKTTIHNSFPIIERLNPVDLVTTGIVKINIFNDSSGIQDMTIFTVIASILLFGVSLIAFRRQGYDSL